MDPVIQVIPTFGIWSGYTPFSSGKPAQVLNIWMTGMASMILSTPAMPLIRLVGITGRAHG